MDWITLSSKFIWGGVAALGFAALFNVPRRTLLTIFLLGGIVVFTKFLLLGLGFSIVMACLCGAALIGFLSIPFAHFVHTPPLIIYIPGIIPMIPGILAYRMMLGLIKLAGDTKAPDYNQVLAETVNNGIKVLFILVSISVGVIVPMLIMRKESVKNIKIIKKKS